MILFPAILSPVCFIIHKIASRLCFTLRGAELRPAPNSYSGSGLIRDEPAKRKLHDQETHLFPHAGPIGRMAERPGTLQLVCGPGKGQEARSMYICIRSGAVIQSIATAHDLSHEYLGCDHSHRHCPCRKVPYGIIIVCSS